MASAGTHTSVKLTRGWSVGMLKVHRYSSTFTPGVSAGTRKQVMPRASPALPEVRANSAQCVAVCMPVVHIFSPSMRQPSMPFLASRTALVSMCVASEPWFGSVRPKVMRVSKFSWPVMKMSFCAGAAEVAQHHDHREVADHRMFVLQVVEQAQPFARQMVADNGHPQVADLLATVLPGQRQAVEARLVRALLAFEQQLLPKRAAAGRRGRSRYAPIHGGGRRSGRCRPESAAAGSAGR